jgi:hypothetical protein
MAIVLLVLLWIVGITGAISVLAGLAATDTSKKQAAAWFALAFLCLMGGLFLFLSEPLTWRRAARDDTIAAYEEYVASHPMGKHVGIARARLAALPGELAGVRNEIASRFAAARRQTSLGGVLTNEFLQHPEWSRLKVLYRRVDPWPADYESSAGFEVNDALGEFGRFIRVDIARHQESSTPGTVPPEPPFPDLTLVVTHSGELAGSYALQGSLLGRTAPGIAVHVRAQLFRPNETAPAHVFEFHGTPSADIRFKSSGSTTEAGMRSVLLHNSYGHAAKAMRDALLLEPIAK